MSKHITIILVAAVISICHARHFARRDVSELFLSKSNEAGAIVYGNGIEGKDAQIENEQFEIDGLGNYNFAYKQTDLQERQEKGEVAINPETGNYTLDNVVGSYRYVRPDGLWQIVEYRADANGFAPKITVEKYEGAN